MTRYLDVAAASKLIQMIGLEQAIAGLAAYIIADYRRWNEFEKSPRAASHSPVGVIELMPTSDGKLYGFKYVNGHPQNTEKCLPTVMAFGVLSEVSTGLPILLSEMTLTTALRTAATSVVAARVLARKNSKTMAVIGCGAQSEFQILGFHAMMGIKEFRIYDTDADAIAKLRRNLSAHEEITLITAASVRAAVKGADIITTITADKSNAAILTADMIEPGMHINGVGGDCPGKTELHPDILKPARVVVEYEPQTRIEGDIQQMPADFPVTELWKILAGSEQGRQNETQVTIFDSVGFALEDFSALRYMYDAAIQRNAGHNINLVPSLQDPKDLYSLLQTVSLPVPPALKVMATVERK
ncbi:MAG: ornithine cyclodeaminase [Alphaproteobacteria bacterium]